MTKIKGHKRKNKISSEHEDSTANITEKVNEVSLDNAVNQSSNSDIALKNDKKEAKKRKRNLSENTKADNVSIEETQESSENNKSKKSKKKKKKAANEGAQGEGASGTEISKRKLKREKHEQRLAEAEEASHKAVQMQALSYLSLWKYNKAEWKFNKVKQIWLYKHKFESDKIPDELWQPYIEYFSAATGGIKQMLLNDCQKVIEEMEKWMEKNEENENDKTKPSEVGYRRARDLLQNIHN